MKENKLFSIVRVVTQKEEIVVSAKSEAEAKRKAMRRQIDEYCYQERGVKVLSAREIP